MFVRGENRRGRIDRFVAHVYQSVKGRGGKRRGVYHESIGGLVGARGRTGRRRGSRRRSGGAPVAEEDVEVLGEPPVLLCLQDRSRRKGAKRRRSSSAQLVAAVLLRVAPFDFFRASHGVAVGRKETEWRKGIGGGD